VREAWRISSSDFWIDRATRDEDAHVLAGNPGGAPFKNRKVRYFSGWAALKSADGAPRDVATSRGLRLHTEGQKVSLRRDDGTPTGYSLELAQLTYEGTETPMLKLGVVDDATGKTVASVWAKPDADRIGLNLGWVQVGLTKSDPHGASPGAEASVAQ